MVGGEASANEYVSPVTVVPVTVTVPPPETVTFEFVKDGVNVGLEAETVSCTSTTIKKYLGEEESATENPLS